MSALRALALATLPLAAAFAADAVNAAAPSLPLDRSGLDPTRLYNFAGFGYEHYTSDETGSDLSRDVLKAQYVVSGFALRAAVPFNVRANPGAGGTVDGFGDIVIGGSYARTMDAKLSVAASFDLSLNTSSKNAVGSNSTIAIPAVYGSYIVDELNRVVAGARWAFSIATESGVRDTSRLEFPLALLHTLPQGLFVAGEVRPGIDFENGGGTFAIAGSAGMVIADRHTLRIRIDLPLDNHSRDTYGWLMGMDYAYNF